VKKFLLLPLVMLSGCAIHAVPVTPRFPEAPATLQEKCEALKEVAADATLTEFTRTVVENYVLYHECSRKVEGWNEWYTRQRDIFETASKK
jgi:outer membrane lipoprotein-sorting protein